MDLILKMCLTFIKIGAFCFGGGYAAVGLIENEVIKTMGWLTPEQFINIIAIAEMTPGPIAVNTSTFAGYLMSGPVAGILCTLCIILIPSCLALLTAFFFIFINNLLGIVPFFPGGANITGNIAVTFAMAMFTFLAVNLFGNKHYYKDIFWPDVPAFLKIFPLMPLIEIIGLFTKPFSLMVRLFANILAGHMMILGVVAVVFLTVELGAAMNSGLTVIAVLFGVFMDVLELLVAFLQAYIFTMLSSVFIGLSRQHAGKEGEEKE